MIPLFDLKMSKSTKNALTRSGDYSDDMLFSAVFEVMSLHISACNACTGELTFNQLCPSVSQMCLTERQCHRMNMIHDD